MNQLYEKALDTIVSLYGEPNTLRNHLREEFKEVIRETECYSGKPFAEHSTNLAPALLIIDETCATIEEEDEDYIEYEVDWEKANKVLYDLIDYIFNKNFVPEG